MKCKIKLFVFDIVLLLSQFSTSDADYECVCNYDILQAVHQLEDAGSSLFGYMSEFDCKPEAPNVQSSGGWYAVMYEHNLGFVKETSNVQSLTCPGIIPATDMYGSTSLLYPPVTTHMPIPTTTRTTTFKPGGNICLACTDSPRTQECLYTMTCETHENCYTDAFENPNGDIIFNMGCRDNQLCGSSGKREVVNRSSGNTLLCAECCTENICNAALCGQTGLPYVGPVCFKCDQASTPSSCNQITLCGRDEVCIVEKIIGLLTHATLYKSGCYHKAQCDRHAHNLSLVGRKRYDNTLMSVL
ncbi:uncharacterized protein LOC127882407 isoform X2 [Dreissena polymorpha]|uniref:uncharacterized protein LOC127882407 isoform X2 n=1 Tax=Dreissena polymorpha TaxID=45954 RepID=UPI002263AF6A|nr:uncharacterized protein LOC127882407 isoform X2 [Dreissena polymorpha]